MGRADRDDTTSAITSKAQKVADGTGGLVYSTPATVVAAYTFSWFAPSAWTRSQDITQYGLTEDAKVLHVSGPYNVLIVVDNYIEIDSDSYRIAGCNPVKGAGGMKQRWAMIVVKIAG